MPQSFKPLISQIKRFRFSRVVSEIAFVWAVLPAFNFPKEIPQESAFLGIPAAAWREKVALDTRRSVRELAKNICVHSDYKAFAESHPYFVVKRNGDLIFLNPKGFEKFRIKIQQWIHRAFLGRYRGSLKEPNKKSKKRRFQWLKKRNNAK